MKARLLLLSCLCCLFSAQLCPGDERMTGSTAPPRGNSLKAAVAGRSGETTAGAGYATLDEALAAARCEVERLAPDDPDGRGAVFFAANPSQQLRAWFSRDGVEVASGRAPRADGEEWSVALRLEAAGRGEALAAQNGGVVEGAGNGVTVTATGGALQQWFVNGQDGLKHGVTLFQKPAGGDGPAVLRFRLEGNLVGALQEDGQSVLFEQPGRGVVLEYKGIHAWDSHGVPLPARMKTGEATLDLIVEDVGAAYPVTIDPLFALAEQRLAEVRLNEGSARLGYSLAVEGDTAIAGAFYGAVAGSSGRGAAYIFVRSGNSWHQQAKIGVPDSNNTNFGRAVALSGNTAVIATIGGIYDNGPVYVYVRQGTVWTQEARLVGDATGTWNPAGVALSGDTLAMGMKADFISPQPAGRIQIYARSGGVWSQQATLTASDGTLYNRMGEAVALSGNTIVSGAAYDDPGGRTNAGSAYVFVRNGTVWSEQAKLIAGDSTSLDQFGAACAVEGDTAVVGAWLDDLGTQTDAGSAYVFVRNGTTWSQQAKLTTGDGLAGDVFGSAVSVSGNTVAAGAPGDDTTNLANAGSAYVFVRNGTAWSQQQKLTSASAAAEDSFGSAVSASGETILAGAPSVSIGTDADIGAAFAFVRNGAVWSSQATLFSDNDFAGDALGTAIAASGSTVLIGAALDDTVSGADAGSAYVFVRSGATWSKQAKLSADQLAAGDKFGTAVALSGDTAVVGAPFGDTGAGADAGRAVAFRRTGVVWQPAGAFSPPAPAAGDQFGAALAVSGDTILAGSPGDDTAVGNDAGSVSVFTGTGTSYEFAAGLTPSSGAAGGKFGNAVALDGGTALIGASGDAAGNGTAWIFSRTGGVWSQEARLFELGPQPVSTFGNPLFGFAVALHGGTAVVAAPSWALGNGAVYVYERNGTSWPRQAQITAADNMSLDFFGIAVAVESGRLLAGSRRKDSVLAGEAGGAYLFSRTGVAWSQDAQLSAGVNAVPGGNLGAAVALAGEYAFAGTVGDDLAGNNAGAVYVYRIGELPQFTSHPVSRTVLPGQRVAFSVTATGMAPLKFQWRRSGVNLPAATAASLTIAAAAVSDAGTYDCVVSNPGGTATSATATLTVNTLSQFQQIFSPAPPAAQGFLIVTLQPPGLLSGWRFSGEQQWRAAGVPAGGLATGDRVIEFRPVPGWLQPPPESVSIISGEPATFVDRQYYSTPAAGQGGLSVVLKPDALAGAQWRFPGEDDAQWRGSGAVRSGLPPGAYLVECRPVPGRSTPPPVSVTVENNQTRVLTLTYSLATALAGTPPAVVPFETVSTVGPLPYGWVGQLRSNSGSGSGFVVMPRVVATAGHVVFDDGSLSAATGLQWLLQRDRGTFEPTPQTPRGFYLFDGYAAARSAPGVVPGESTATSQNLDVAALYFVAAAGNANLPGRGGSSGFLASDSVLNEFLLSPAQKILAGYSVDGIPAAAQGRLHATPPLPAVFTRASGQVYTTADLRSSGGASGGPLCVQFEGGAYYPAAVYLGGNTQTLVRALDSAVIDLFQRAATSGSNDSNNTGGGITLTIVTGNLDTAQPGAVKVLIEPAAARAAGAGWRLQPETAWRAPDTQKSSLTAGTYVLECSAVAGFSAPVSQIITVTGGQLSTYTCTYTTSVLIPDAWRLANFGTTANAGNAADTADPDGDGMNNLAEFAAGTNPNSASDRFKVLTTARTATSFTATAAGRAGRSYLLERSAAALASGSWASVASQGPLATDGPVSLTDSAIPPKAAFYRIRVTVP